MKVKVSELEGKALDWAVACVMFGKPFKTAKFNDEILSWFFQPNLRGEASWVVTKEDHFLSKSQWVFEPSCNWAHTGILIDECRLTIRDLRHYAQGKFLVSCEYTGEDDDYTVEAEPHKDAKIAICRAVCMTENGKDEIEIPDELLEASHA